DADHGAVLQVEDPATAAAAGEGEGAGLHGDGAGVVERDADAGTGGAAAGPGLLEGARVVDRGRPGEEVAQAAAVLQNQRAARAVGPDGAVAEGDRAAGLRGRGAVAVNDPAVEGGVAEPGGADEDRVPGAALRAAGPGPLPLDRHRAGPAQRPARLG